MLPVVEVPGRKGNLSVYIGMMIEVIYIINMLGRNRRTSH
jgi:hypothetical protein